MPIVRGCLQNENALTKKDPFWLTPVQSPFFVSNIQFFALSYQTEEVDFTHPSIAKIALPTDLSAAVHKRKAEYVMGRYSAKKALALMNIEGAVSRNLDKSPRWPPNLVGSITHTCNFSMAAVGNTKDYRAIGIDSEIMRSSIQIESLVDQFMSLEEKSLVDVQGLKTAVWPYIVFSAKESVYKALYPIVQQFFGFFDVQMTAIEAQDAERGTLTVALTKQIGCFHKGFVLTCSYLVNTPYIHTYVLL